MNLRTPLAALVAAAALIITSGCAVTRGQESTGAYVDDAVDHARTVKAKMVEDKNVDAVRHQGRDAQRRSDAVGLREELDREEHRREHRHEGQGREDGQEPDRGSPVIPFEPAHRAG